MTSSRLPLLAYVGAVIPDRHLAGAVVARRDRAVKVEVGERVVLDMHRLAVALGVLGNPVRNRPGGEHPIALQAQVPVQPSRMMLVDDEPRTGRDGGSGSGAGSGVAAKLRLRPYSLSFAELVRFAVIGWLPTLSPELSRSVGERVDERIFS